MGKEDGTNTFITVWGDFIFRKIFLQRNPYITVVQLRSTRVHFVVASRARVGRCTPRGAGRDAGDLAAERESDPQRGWRSRGHGAGRRGGDEEGDEAEESPSHEGAVRARGEVSVAMQGVQRLSAREAAQSMQGMRRGINLQARSSAL